MRLVKFVFLAAAGAVTAFGSVDSDLLAMAPAGATLLTGIDVARAQESAFGNYILNEMRSDDSRFQQFIAATGFDPRRDLQDVLVAGVAGQSGPNSKFAILARGNFDEGRIRAAVLAQGATISTVNGTETLIIRKHHQASTVGLAFPKPGIAVLTDLKTMQEILTPQASHQSLDAQLVEQVNQVGAENDIWFATLMSGSFLGHELAGAAPADTANSGTLKSILRSSGGMQFGNTVVMSLELFTRSEADARSVSDLLRFASNFAQMQQSDARAATAAVALSNLQLQTEGAKVRASLNVTEQQLEQFMQSAKKGSAPGR